MSLLSSKREKRKEEVKEMDDLDGQPLSKNPKMPETVCLGRKRKCSIQKG